MSRQKGTLVLCLLIGLTAYCYGQCDPHSLEGGAACDQRIDRTAGKVSKGLNRVGKDVNKGLQGVKKEIGNGLGDATKDVGKTVGKQVDRFFDRVGDFFHEIGKVGGRPRRGRRM
ncbi:hypothetical protein OEZ86_012818 [Tetradesmus obliquus]|nr:hypothetical protein OEZ86_012818 [Tetradesmus obliquus]